MAVDQTFPKSFRLIKNREFRSVFLHGKKIAYGGISAFVLKEKDKKVGISVSSKKLRKAVDRNYVKRVLREIIRREKEIIPENRYIVFLYNKREVMDYAEIKKGVSHIFQRLQ